MMHLEKLSLVNYKSFDQLELSFGKHINCIVGNNGLGKTNILDAIYHLSFGKGYFNPLSTQNIRHGTDFYLINGLYHLEEKEEKVVCSFKKGVKKILKRNDKVYDRLSDHVGFIPLVMISPSDQDLISSGSDGRRKFIDGILCQYDRVYLQHLISYHKVLVQRNALLKYFHLNQTFDATTLGIYNEQLELHGHPIYKKRVEFLADFVPVLQSQYKSIAHSKEGINVEYNSHLHQTQWQELLDHNLKKDRSLQHTTTGIHKDDFNFLMDGHAIKKFGSQGQKKSFLIALRFAQLHTLKNIMKRVPLLLLDDIFDKLDEHRVQNLMQLVQQDGFGQIFITDTHNKRTENVVRTLDLPYQMFDLNDLMNV